MAHRHDLYTRWSTDIRRQEFFNPGQKVGVAVSGGPDSVLLLHFLKQLGTETGFSVVAVHFNHRLRGVEADGDETLVRDLAEELEIEYLRSEGDVGRIAHEQHSNLEAIARDLRYRFFFSLIQQGKVHNIATGHTSNDQAETVLMRLLRGAGTRGLGGIYPVLDGKIFRPFLGTSRPQVMEEIKARGLKYRIDSTNLNLHLQRNKVRHELLPLLEKEYNPGIFALLNELADRSRDNDDLLESLAAEQAKSLFVREGLDQRIAAKSLQELHPALARRVLRRMLHLVRGGASGTTYLQIEKLRQFAEETQSGKVLNLPGGVVARKEFSWMVVGPSTRDTEAGDFSYSVSVPGEVLVQELGKTFRLKILATEDFLRAYNQTTLSGLDPQKLEGQVTLRNWRAGDSFCPAGNRKVRKLKELFRERKIPEGRRKSWPVMLSGDKVIWVRGFAPAKDFAANPDAPQVLIVEEEPVKPAPVGPGKAL